MYAHLAELYTTLPTTNSSDNGSTFFNIFRRFPMSNKFLSTGISPEMTFDVLAKICERLNGLCNSARFFLAIATGRIVKLLWDALWRSVVSHVWKNVKEEEKENLVRVSPVAIAKVQCGILARKKVLWFSR